MYLMFNLQKTLVSLSLPLSRAYDVFKCSLSHARTPELPLDSEVLFVIKPLPDGSKGATVLV